MSDSAADPASSGANADAIARELAWLGDVVDAVLRRFGDPDSVAPDLMPPSLADAGGAYAALVRELGLGANERLVLALAIAPHVAPERLDPLALQNSATGRRFTEFGGVIGQSHNGFLPTLATALFLLSGIDQVVRLSLLPVVSPDAPLFRRGVLTTEPPAQAEPPTAAVLRLSDEYYARLLTGAAPPAPPLAHRLVTPLAWDDLVLDADALAQVAMIGDWIAHRANLRDVWALGAPGYRCLFQGPPGTGKTLVAALLGKAHGCDVYRIDMASVVSRYIGETEARLASLFDRAAREDWILYFDNLDALLGRVTSAAARAIPDHLAAPIADLLARIGAYPGLVILSTHLPDPALVAGVDTVIRFPMPDAAQRLALWTSCLGHAATIPLAPDVDLPAIAAAHELSSGAIINVVRHLCLMALRQSPPQMTASDLGVAIRRELAKRSDKPS